MAYKKATLRQGQERGVLPGLPWRLAEGGCFAQAALFRPQIFQVSALTSQSEKGMPSHVACRRGPGTQFAFPEKEGALQPGVTHAMVRVGGQAIPLNRLWCSVCVPREGGGDLAWRQPCQCEGRRSSRPSRQPLVLSLRSQRMRGRFGLASPPPG
ncbi:hypothetical protein ROHU_027770 [Labeo rohita]|uniref:Uncharacterized protein n=1 Tax=Labeo rohita TaxID=84645 RepID=A0A498M9T2_LABRO|nr:hypothetical protein ROHU_027770 [Labeo rohita]